MYEGQNELSRYLEKTWICQKVRSVDAWVKFHLYLSAIISSLAEGAYNVLNVRREVGVPKIFLFNVG